MKQAFLEKVREREAIIAVVGLGYVGLPLALRFSECGFRVIGIDTDAERVIEEMADYEAGDDEAAAEPQPSLEVRHLSSVPGT